MGMCLWVACFFVFFSKTGIDKWRVVVLVFEIFYGVVCFGFIVGVIGLGCRCFWYSRSSIW